MNTNIINDAHYLHPSPIHTSEIAPHSRFNFIELLEASLASPEPIIEDLFYQGHNAIFAAAFGQGKTYFNLDASVHVALGRNFLGRQVKRPYRTCFLDTENGGAEIKSRLRTLAEKMKLSEADKKHLAEFWTYEDLQAEGGQLAYVDLSRKEGMKALDEFISFHQPEVIFANCFGKLFRAEERDETAMKDFCAGLSLLTRKHECLSTGGMIFLHHIRKPTDDDAGYSLLDNPTEFLGKTRGSGRLLDFMQDRIAMQEQRQAGETCTIVHGVGRSCAMVPLILQRSFDGFFEPHENAKFVEQRLFGTSMRQINLFEVVRNRFDGRGKFTFTEVSLIKDNAGKPFHMNTVNDTLKKAVSGGLVIKGLDGKYEFPVNE